MEKEKVLLGVCLWIGNRFNLSITGIRIVLVVAVILGFRMPLLSISPLLLYLVLYLLKPKNHENW